MKVNIFSFANVREFFKNEDSAEAGVFLKVKRFANVIEFFKNKDSAEARKNQFNKNCYISAP